MDLFKTEKAYVLRVDRPLPDFNCLKRSAGIFCHSMINQENFPFPDDIGAKGSIKVQILKPARNLISPKSVKRNNIPLASLREAFLLAKRANEVPDIHPIIFPGSIMFWAGNEYCPILHNSPLGGRALHLYKLSDMIRRHQRLCALS